MNKLKKNIQMRKYIVKWIALILAALFLLTSFATVGISIVRGG